MRILHTADWHLNDRLGRIDRTDDLRAAVERVAALCREQAVDVLIVSGDLFSELARPDALRESIRHWQDVFAGFLAGGGTILTLTGNHDNENFCQTLRHAMTLAAPTRRSSPATMVPPGRLYLAAEPTFFRISATAPTRSTSQFVLMPYPTPTRYLKGEAGQKYTSQPGREEQAAHPPRSRSTMAGLPGIIREVSGRALTGVLSAHATVRGAEHRVESLFRLQRGRTTCR